MKTIKKKKLNCDKIYGKTNGNYTKQYKLILVLFNYINVIEFVHVYYVKISIKNRRRHLLNNKKYKKKKMSNTHILLYIQKPQTQ